MENEFERIANICKPDEDLKIKGLVKCKRCGYNYPASFIEDGCCPMCNKSAILAEAEESFRKSHYKDITMYNHKTGK